MKPVVLVTASIHASEIGGSQSIPLLLYELASDISIETQSILDNVITILVPSMNPGGLELVREWYESTLGTDGEGSLPPYPDHPVGHDINRDWVMLTQPETRALHQSVLLPWRPDVHLDLHEMHTTGPRYSLPPFLDPVDPHLHHQTVEDAARLGRAVAEHMRHDGHRGVVTQTFFDAFAPTRSYVNYHGGVRILAEAAAARLATSVEVPRPTQTASPNALVYLSERRLSWTGGPWTLRDMIRYHLDSTRGLLTVVARDTVSNSRHESTDPIVASGSGWLVLPYALQRDPLATNVMLDVLLQGEIEVERLEEPLFLNGVSIPAGAFYIRHDQPFIEYANTLLEPTLYPGDELSSPTRTHVPYDVTAHSLPLLMGVDTIRLPVKPIVTATIMQSATKPVGWIRGRAATGYFAIPPVGTAPARLVNAALKQGVSCRRTVSEIVIGDQKLQAGTFLLAGMHRNDLEGLVRDTGIVSIALDSEEIASSAPITAPKIGIYRGYVNDFEDSGWTSYVLDHSGFSCRILNDAYIRAGDFADLSAIILPSQKGETIRYGLTTSKYPETFRGGIGRQGAESLKAFVSRGGTLIALGSGCDAALAILPSSAFNSVSALDSEEFQTPGVIVRLSLDTAHPVCWGLEPTIAAMVTNSPVFSLARDAISSFTPFAHYSGDDPLIAGWIHGRQHVLGRAAMIEIRVGSGRAYLLGCRPQFRGMAHGTYPLLFNAIYASSMGQISYGT